MKSSHSETQLIHPSSHAAPSPPPLLLLLLLLTVS